MEEKINYVLDNLRPYLNSDGGDVEFIKYEDGIVFVKLTVSHNLWFLDAISFVSTP